MDCCINRFFGTNDTFLLEENVMLDIFDYLSSNNLGNGGGFTPCDIDITYYPNRSDIVISLCSDLDCNKDVQKCSFVNGTVDGCEEWEYYTYHDILEDYKDIGSIDQWFRHHYNDIVSKFKELYFSLK